MLRSATAVSLTGHHGISQSAEPALGVAQARLQLLDRGLRDAAYPGEPVELAVDLRVGEPRDAYDLPRPVGVLVAQVGLVLAPGPVGLLGHGRPRGAGGAAAAGQGRGAERHGERVVFGRFG